ncbi:MAG: 30S ribosomal protein S1 [Rickettsiaceae bacterium]|nr:30S ribosomal protein S1 [Rickettsiaceae bacterium]MDP4832798.1 30S ribosomal protein S1 [Rickettsiaceae bacterium]MDP5020790.1 30S ribosomal protein S1 [Rickettsiaceae bacterium]MDP5083368.1 30S ribosomal protein S1 [Rickettsiaceae bacterium]
MKANKKRFIPQLADFTPSTEDFSKLLESVDTSHVKEGSVVKGQVVDVGPEVIIVDVGLKNEGRIAVSEFQMVKGTELPKIGDIVDVYVERVAGRRGTVLSREKAIREDSWVKLEQIFEKQENVTGVIFGRVKGGFTVDLDGVVAFLPGSQADVRPIKDPTSIMDIPQPFQILKMDRKLGNIVVSRKAILEESRSEAREEMLAQIKEGDVLDGVVKNITDYGAFVDLGSVDGLLHVTDISWSRINHPSEVLTFGQEIKVVVIKFNEDTKRISLGMKQLDANPWDNITEEIPVGKVMNGKVTNIADYGVFIELKDGIEGLVHSSEICWGKTNQNPKKLLTIGQEVEFVILDVDIDRHRISLSIKKCQDNPLVKFAQDNPVGSIIKAPIRNITDFGMFVAIDLNTDGMIHESDLSWEGNGAELLKNYTKGDEVECKVLSIDVDKDRVALGVKQLTADPYEGQVDEFKKNMVVTCTVVTANNDGLEVTIDGKAFGFIKKVDLSSERSEQKTDRFVEGDRLDAKVITVDKASRKLSLSVKALEMDERDKAIKEYGSTDSGASLGDILGAVLEEGKK